MHHLGICQDQHITTRSRHAAVECNARVKRRRLVLKPDDPDRPWKLAGLGWLWRTIVDDDDLDVFSRVEAPVLTQVPA